MTRQLAMLIIACALAAALAAPAALGQERTPLRVGVVDMNKVLDEYKEFQQSDSQYKAFLRERQDLLAERASLRLLTTDELKQHENLKAVVAPSDEQKARMEQLRAVAQSRETELKNLTGLTSPTEDDKKRLAELQELAKNGNAALDEMQTRATEEINARNKELSNRLEQKIQSALAAVAKDKHLDLVLAKEAALYGGIEMTGDVLAKLNTAP